MQGCFDEREIFDLQPQEPRHWTEQLQNTGPFFVVYVGSPVALSVYRTSKVYKVYYLSGSAARRLASRVEWRAAEPSQLE